MKTIFSPDLLPAQALLLTCSSHEARCEGFVSRLAGWKPTGAVIFHYDDVNPKREIHHKTMVDTLDAASTSAVTLQFSESNAVMSLRDNMNKLKEILASRKNDAIVLDISVFTKRHLLMILRWLDDEGYWDKLCVIYTAPEDYDVSQFIPLSFGIASFQQIPGFSACPALSRPVHLVLFLGYEGDRVLATYEHVQPMQTTLVIPHPPYQPSSYQRIRGPELFERLMRVLVETMLEPREGACLTVTQAYQAFCKLSEQRSLGQIKRSMFKAIMQDLVRDEYGMGLRRDVPDSQNKHQEAWKGLKLVDAAVLAA